MAKPLVFFLHGMGTHEAGWSKDAVSILEKRAASLRSNWTFTAQELEYDSKFRDLLGAWSKASKEVISAAHPSNQERVKGLVSWLNKADDKSSFAWSAAADVFLWRTSKIIRNLIINHLANQVAPVIAKARAGTVLNVHFVVHSLGTAVAHELLSAMARGAWTSDGDVQVDGLESTRWRPAGIHMVANVSKLLELERNPAYESPVCPGPTAEATSYCKTYRSYDHRFDPIARVGAFKPPWAANNRYAAFEPMRIKSSKAVHELTHYVSLPVVNVPMLESMFGSLPPDSGALDDVPDGFKTPSTAVKNSLKEEIEKFGVDPDLFQTMRAVYEFFKARL